MLRIPADFSMEECTCQMQVRNIMSQKYFLKESELIAEPVLSLSKDTCIHSLDLYLPNVEKCMILQWESNKEIHRVLSVPLRFAQEILLISKLLLLLVVFVCPAISLRSYLRRIKEWHDG